MIFCFTNMSHYFVSLKLYLLFKDFPRFLVLCIIWLFSAQDEKLTIISIGEHDVWVELRRKLFNFLEVGNANLWIFV